MKAKKCIAMVLAGGRGARLGALTQYYSKPAIHFGGNHRIIDFTLSNCKISGMDIISILSQYFTTDLNEYICSAYDGESGRRGVYLLPSKNEKCSYKGTADAVYQNLAFIESFMPQNVLILASDHVYRMDYSNLLEFHEEKRADVTVASIHVSNEEAQRFGIINSNETGRVFSFEEKPKIPKSNLASMGVYVFKWSVLKECLHRDSRRVGSNHDFGKDIIPRLLSSNRLYTYQFNGYWRDVGTVDKLWEANMDQLNGSCLQLTRLNAMLGKPSISKYIRHSVLGDQVTVGHGAEIVNSVIMPNVRIGNNVKIINAIVGNHAVIRDGVVIGKDYGDDYFVDHQVCSGDVSLVSPWADIDEGTVIRKNSHVVRERLKDYYSARRHASLCFEEANHVVI